MPMPVPARYLEFLIGLALTAVFARQSEVDVVTGAAYNSRGIAAAAAEEGRRVIWDQLG
jgi:hypothetical protein